MSNVAKDSASERAREEPSPSLSAARAMRHNRLGASGKKIVLVALSTAVTLLAVEVGMQVLAASGLCEEFFALLGHPRPPLDSKTGPGLYYVHPYTSYAIKPGYRSEGWASINSLGFRGRETTRQKPPGTFRVIALGGSTTYGIYQDDSGTYPLLLERELRRRLQTDKVEVINAGLVSATTAESLHRMFVDILPMEPDMVVLYHGFNDLVPRVFNNFSDDYYHFRRINPQGVSLLGRSFLYRLALKVLAPDQFSCNVRLTAQIWKYENLPADEAARVANFNNTSSAVFETNMEHIILAALARKIEVVLATFAFDGEKPNWTRDVPAALWPLGIDQNNQAIRRLSQRYDLPLIDFYSYGLTDGTMFEDSIHMSEEGNGKKAAFFADSIAPIIAGQMGR